MTKRYSVIQGGERINKGPLRIEFDVHEADEASPEPGALYGRVVLVDAMGRQVYARDLDAEERKLLVALGDRLRQSCLDAVRAEVIA